MVGATINLEKFWKPSDQWRLWETKAKGRRLKGKGIRGPLNDNKSKATRLEGKVFSFSTHPHLLLHLDPGHIHVCCKLFIYMDNWTMTISMQFYVFLFIIIISVLTFMAQQSNFPSPTLTLLIILVYNK